MRIAVVGGTGMIGAPIVQELIARHHEVRVLSRHSSTYSVDLATGAGLEKAIAGCDAVVDASNAPWSGNSEEVLIKGCQRLIDTERNAGVSHHLCVSIVGCDRVPARYYKAKTRQEEVVRGAKIPWTIVRATQFHEFIEGMFLRAAKYGLLPAPRIPIQTVARSEAANFIAGVVERPSVRKTLNLAGPEISDIATMAKQWRRITARKAILFPVPLWGSTARLLKEGVLTDPSPDVRGKTSFEEYLTNNSPASPTANSAKVS